MSPRSTPTRRAVLPLLAAPALALAGGVPAQAASPLPARQRVAPEITFATYDVNRGIGADGELDMSRILDTLRTTGADVIALQNVERNWVERADVLDQAGFLAKKLGMKLAFAPTVDMNPFEQGGPRRQLGVAVLSRYKIKTATNMWLPSQYERSRHTLQTVTIAVRGVTFRVHNTELDETSTELRLDQLKHIDYVLGTEVRMPTILAGDFKVREDAPEYAVMTRRLRDVWDLAGQGQPGTWQTPTLGQRLDYVLVDDLVTPVWARVLPSTASGHAPLVTHLRLPVKA